MSEEGRYIPPLASEIVAPPVPPPRRIGPEEGAELIRRLNQPDGWQIVLDADEQTYISAQPPIRDREAVRWLIRELRDDPEPDSDFYQAILETLDWAYGRSPRGPLSGERADHQPPTCGDIEYEESVAVRYMYGQTSHTESPLPRSQDWAVGVEHTCLWLRCATGDPPWGPPPGEV